MSDHKLTIEFPDERAMQTFKVWMSDCGGEQQYMEVLEMADMENEDEDAPLTYIKLDYHDWDRSKGAPPEGWKKRFDASRVIRVTRIRSKRN